MCGSGWFELVSSCLPTSSGYLIDCHRKIEYKEEIWSKIVNLHAGLLQSDPLTWILLPLVFSPTKRAAARQRDYGKTDEASSTQLKMSTSSPDLSQFTLAEQQALSWGIPISALHYFDHPNYVNPPNNGPGLLAIFGICLALSWTMVPLRLYCRTSLLKASGLDDVFMICALVLATLMSIFSIMVVHYGVGKHLYDVPLQDMEPLLK